MSTLISCNDITKYFANKVVFANISFCVNEGEKILLVGANGSGKSTLANIICGLIRPSSGLVLVDNLEPYSNHKIRCQIGFAPQELPFPDFITVEEFLSFTSSHMVEHYSVEEMLEVFLLKSIKNCYANKLSGGQKRRLILALAFINKPRIVILDEPINALDACSRDIVIDFINSYITNKDVTSIVITHVMDNILINTRTINL